MARNKPAPRTKEQNTDKPPTVMGRPRIEINFDQFEQLCGLQCTEEEIASFFSISVSTLTRRIAEHYRDENGKGRTFEDVYKEYSARGLISLRREQWRNAVTGKNTAMQIWLGKQYLGQLDNPQPRGTSDGERVEYDIRESLYSSGGETSASDGAARTEG